MIDRDKIKKAFDYITNETELKNVCNAMIQVDTKLNLDEVWSQVYGVTIPSKSVPSAPEEYHKYNDIIVVNLAKIEYVIRYIYEGSDKPESDVDGHIYAQCMLTLLHEISHKAIDTNYDLYHSDDGYKDFIEARVNKLSCELLLTLVTPLSKILSIDAGMIFNVAYTNLYQLVYTYANTRGIPLDLNIAERVLETK